MTRESTSSRASSSASISSSRAFCDVSSSYSVTLGESCSISIGSTASAPWTRKNGVSCVAVFGVVRMLHKTLGNSSGQVCRAFSSGPSRRFLRPLQMIPLAFSTYPLVCGCPTDAKCNLMPTSAQYSLNSLDVKFEPLSVTML